MSKSPRVVEVTQLKRGNFASLAEFEQFVQRNTEIIQIVRYGLARLNGCLPGEGDYELSCPEISCECGRDAIEAVRIILEQETANDG